jgi:hypothetical protein
MDHAALIRRLAAFAQTLPAAVAGVTEAEARWKPPSGNWSILEVCAHLLDEEREDFRARLAATLRDPSESWPTLALEGIAERRAYNQRDLRLTVAEFVEERRESVRWLTSLGEADWGKAHVHPRFGPIAAGDLLAAWSAHDALHLRQIAKRLFELAGHDAGRFTTRYAGDWGP